MRRELRVVGDVVAMRQKHLCHAAHRLDPLDQWGGKPRRINEHVTALLRRPHDQIGPGAEACLRRIAAEEDIVDDVRGKRVRGRASIPVTHGAD